jgi:SNF5 / SMARCB1 / INI1
MATTTNASPPSKIAASPHLIPLRVDVTSDDGTIRLVDTIVLDPHCWPIPLYAPLQDAVEANAQELAHAVLADAEVYGMGRTVRHFTGRVDIWSPAMQAKVAQQLRPQMWSILESEREEKGGMIPIHLRISINGIMISDDFQWDTKVSQCPIAFAQQLAEDMKLPEEAVPAIVTAIVEQLHGLSVEGSAEATSAVMIDPREQVTNISHLAAFQRPAQLDPRMAFS